MVSKICMVVEWVDMVVGIVVVMVKICTVVEWAAVMEVWEVWEGNMRNNQACMDNSQVSLFKRYQKRTSETKHGPIQKLKTVIC